MRLSSDFLEAGKAYSIKGKGTAIGNLLSTKTVLSDGVQKMMLMNILSLWHLVNLGILARLNGAIFLFSTNSILQAFLDRVHQEV